MNKLVVYNIEYCEGMTGHWYEYLKFWRAFSAPKKIDERIIAELKKVDPDILALVEVDTGSFRSKNQDEVVFFEKNLGMKSFVEAVKYPFMGWIRLFHFVPILNHQANAIIAKKELKEIKYYVLHEGTKRVVIEAHTYLPQKVRLILVHLALGHGTRAKQIEELINIVNQNKEPVILMGDFNTFNGEEEIAKLLESTHLDDMFRLTPTCNNYTEPSCHPSKRLDYVLTSKDIKVNDYKVLKYDFSDHLPLFVDFDVMPTTD